MNNLQTNTLRSSSFKTGHFSPLFEQF